MLAHSFLLSTHVVMIPANNDIIIATIITTTTATMTVIIGTESAAFGLANN